MTEDFGMNPPAMPPFGPDGSLGMTETPSVPQVNPLDELQAQLAREAGLKDLHQWAVDFIQKSRDWRRQSFEERWFNYQRDADAIYDPGIASLKKPWQSKAFIPLVPSHRETLQAQLYKTIIGARPVLEMKARGKFMDPHEDQAENIRDLILREVEKSRFEVGFNKVLDDATTYGSGLCRIRYETKTEDRKIRLPELQAPDIQAIEYAGQLPERPAVSGYGEQIVPVVTYRGVRFDWVSIWDFYPDPRSLEIKGSPCGIAYPITYGDVVKGATEGYFFPEAVEKLKNTDDQNDTKNSGKREVKANREISDVTVSMPDYGKQLGCFEIYAKLPKKWVYVRGEQIDDPEKLVPARLIVHPNCVLTVEAHDQYEGDAPVFKMDYMPVNGQFYGRGIPEMLGALQDVLNEGVNARIDAIAIALNKSFAVIEQFLINPKEIGTEPGMVARIDAKAMRQAGFDDIRKVMMELPLGQIDRAAFIDPQEMERYAQERTSASKVTLGTAGQTGDTNDTLGGMELLRQTANEKIAYIGMLSEFGFLHEIFREFFKVIYLNLTPEDVQIVLGERAQFFRLLAPEQVEQDYKYQPQGIFTQENKAQSQARLASIFQQFQPFPWTKPEAFFDRELQSNNEDPLDFRLTDQELYQKLMAEGSMQQANEPLEPPAEAEPAKPKKKKANGKGR